MSIKWAQPTCEEFKLTWLSWFWERLAHLLCLKHMHVAKGNITNLQFQAVFLSGRKLICLRRISLINTYTYTFTDTDVTLPYLVEGATVMEQPHATTVPPFPFCWSKSIETSFSVCRSVLHGSKYTHRSDDLLNGSPGSLYYSGLCDC